jgi:hypothetical protein
MGEARQLLIGSIHQRSCFAAGLDSSHVLAADAHRFEAAGVAKDKPAYTGPSMATPRMVDPLRLAELGPDDLARVSRRRLALRPVSGGGGQSAGQQGPERDLGGVHPLRCLSCFRAGSP